MINHFGINPVRGGKPPKDIRVTRMKIVISGVLLSVIDSELIVVVRLIISSINIVTVIGIYR